MFEKQSLLIKDYGYYLNYCNSQHNCYSYYHNHYHYYYCY